MRTLLVFLALVGVAAIAWSVGAAFQDHAPVPTELKLNNLITQTLAEQMATDREVIVSYVEIPPNTTMDRHWHPGEEFHYYIEGKVTIDFGDGEQINGTPGNAAHVPYKRLHTAITGEEASRFVVFRIHEKGKPVRFLEDGSAADK